MDERLARKRRGEDVGGDHVVLVDEFQEWTGSANGEGQKVGQPKQRMRAAMERIARRGRAAGVRLILASQHYDGRTLEEGILANIGWRAIGYAPKKMSKEALGELAERYNLDTSTLFVDEVQKGASVVSGGRIHPYTSQRSYLITPDDLVAIAGRARSLRSKQQTPQDQQAGVPAREAAQQASEFSGGYTALLAAPAEYIDGEGRDEIASGELWEEANPEGLTRNAYGAALDELGIPKQPGRTPSRRVADIRRALPAHRRAA